MKVAVLSLVRDRREYTEHCFASLHAFAGCSFDHYVLDQGSGIETRMWLERHAEYFCELVMLTQNVGIHSGHNRLLDLAFSERDYDVVVTFDNDCEVTMPRTLAVAARVALNGNWIISPSVLGLINTPAPRDVVIVDGERVGPWREIGGIFRVMPGSFAREFRFDESRPLWGRDEVDVGAAAHRANIGVGYLLDWTINHYKTTLGQQADLPGYFARKFAEMT